MTDPAKAAPRPEAWRAGRVVAAYALFATLWILFSDRLLAGLATDRDALVRWGMIKGVLFVAVTSLLLLVLIRRALADIARGRSDRALLMEQDALLRIAGRAARLGGWALELPERTLRWSDEVCLMHDRPVGYQPTLAEGLAHFVPEDRPVIQAHMERCEREGTPYDLELRKVTATGRHIWVRTLGAAVRDEAGRLLRLQGAFQDITERKLAEIRIREQAELLDKAQDAILVRGLDHRVRYWNKSAERLYGWSRAEAEGRLVYELFYPDLVEFERAQAQLLEKGEWVGEIDQRTKAGGEVTVEGHWTLVRDDSGAPTAVLAINTDITQRKALERQFLRAQRMESIGTLAGGIAHDLNNVLAPIVLSVDLLKHTTADPESLETIEQIGSSARRGTEMIRQVLSFARGMEGRRVAVRPGEILHEAVAILRDTFPKQIRLVERAEGDLWLLEADPTQVQQVIINLCVNARDALPNGGEVVVSAENVVVDEHLAARTLGARVGLYVKIEVADNGTGIPPGIVDRIFEPFFTTKDTGKGTGLGLSTTQAIVKSHGGFIKVFSEPGAGSHFRIYFPAHPSAIPAPASPEELAGLPRGAGELVLVIDDEAPIRQVIRQTLETFGYRTLLAADGTEGVRRFAEHDDEVHAVLTDMMMPGLDGPATIEALRRVDPGVRIIGMSGVADNGGIAQVVGSPGTELEFAL